jgi:hypothetical protein
MLFNGYSNGSLLNLALTIPQLIFVIFLLFKRNTSIAFLYHLIFFCSSFTSFNYSGVSYNYAKLELFSGVYASHLLILFIFCKGFISRKVPFCDENFKRLTQIVFYYFCVGSFVGIIGILFYDYSSKMFIHYFSYILIVFLTVKCLRFWGENIRDKLKNVFVMLLILHPFISITLFIVNNDATNSNGFALYCVLLIPALFLFNIFFISTSGKELIMIIGIIGFVFFQYFNKKGFLGMVFKYTRLLLFVAVIPFFLNLLQSNLDSSSFLSSKSYQVQELGLIFSNNIEELPSSPLVRVASLLNILNDWKVNYFTALFGNGYGGSFKDNLGLLDFALNDESSYNADTYRDGRFYYTHDALITVPFLHGIIGTLLFLYLVKIYVKNGNSNYLSLAVIPFLLFVFYFNILFAVTGSVFLYLSSNFLPLGKVEYEK